MSTAFENNIDHDYISAERPAAFENNLDHDYLSAERPAAVENNLDHDYLSAERPAAFENNLDHDYLSAERPAAFENNLDHDYLSAERPAAVENNLDHDYLSTERPRLSAAVENLSPNVSTSSVAVQNNLDHKFLSDQLAISSTSVQYRPVLDHDYLAPIKHKKKKVNNAMKNRLKTHILTIPIMKSTQSDKQSDLSLFQGTMLKSVLSKTRNISKIVSAFMSIPHVRQYIVDDLSLEMGNVPETMRNKKRGFVSILMRKETENLQSADLGRIVSEMKTKFPVLLQMLQAMMIPDNKREDDAVRASIIPKLALIYGIVIQSRCHELSFMQRLVAMVLVDNRCDQAVSHCICKINLYSCLLNLTFFYVQELF